MRPGLPDSLRPRPVLGSFEPSLPDSSVRENPILLGSNENPLGPSPRVLARLRDTSLQIHRYPDPAGRSLRARLGESCGVRPDQVALGAGSAGIITDLANALLEPNENAVMPDVAYPVYARVTRLTGASAIEVPVDDALRIDLDEMYSAIGPQTRLVFLTLPNNPTGLLLPDDKVLRFLGRLPPHVLCVLDLAYAEYVSEGFFSAYARHLSRFPNMVLLGTFSKVYGLAGLRLGYAVAAPEVISWIDKVRMPFSVGVLAMEAGLAALDDQEHVRRSVEQNSRMMTWLENRLKALGMQTRSGRANFVLVDVGRDAVAVGRALLARGIVVRPMTHPRLRTALRITVGTEEQMRALVEAMPEALDEL